VKTPAILRWRDRLTELGAPTSPEGCAVLAGVELLSDRGLRGRSVVAILTGAADQWPSDEPEVPDDDAVRLASYLEVRSFFMDLGLAPA
jgi:hypothetical protein